MKNICFTVLVIFGCCCTKVFAQGGVPMSLRPDFARIPSGISAIQMQRMTMNNLMNLHWYDLDQLRNYAYDFSVTMKDGTQRIVSSKIYSDTLTHRSYLIIVNHDLKRSDPNRQQKIYVNETSKITRIENMATEPDQPARNFEVSGFPTDSCWLFKVMSGKIDAYSNLSEIRNIDNFYLRAIKVGDAPISKIDSATLATALTGNEKALKAFRKKDYYKAIDRYNNPGN
jgi:hypothetical protein